MFFFAPGREPHPSKRQGRGREKKSGVVRAQRALRESASPVKVHQKKDITEKVVFLHQDENHTRRKGREEEGRRNRVSFVLKELCAKAQAP